MKLDEYKKKILEDILERTKSISFLQSKLKVSAEEAKKLADAFGTTKLEAK